MITQKSVPLPPFFLQRMSQFLGEEFEPFQAALDGEAQSGLRVNTLKMGVQAFREISPAPLGDSVAWCPSAFHLPASDFRFGSHPYHGAGLYYLQDPSAMSPAALLNPQPGERVLDLSAAPGGKTTQLAAQMRGEGLLVANEIKTKRVGHLVQNVERWGAGNVIITNETPEALADHFGAFFDRVLVDAPCSGEGMFRKDMGARADWSPEMVQGCAVRQQNILRVATKLVKPGGFLLYSTCTFAPEEDEGALLELLSASAPAQFEVQSLPLYEGFTPGKPEWLGETAPLSLRGAVRLFPHRVRGEGHFACLLRRVNEAQEPPRPAKGRSAGWGRKTEKADLRFWQSFAQDLLTAPLPEENLRLFGDRLYLTPSDFPDLGRLRVTLPGVWLGTVKKDRFEPAHPLALFLRPGEAQKTVALDLQSPLVQSYLRGETLPTETQGWAVVSAGGWNIGWGKGSQGILKNHFPRGWM